MFFPQAAGAQATAKKAENPPRTPDSGNTFYIIYSGNQLPIF